ILSATSGKTSKYACAAEIRTRYVCRHRTGCRKQKSIASSNSMTPIERIITPSIRDWQSKRPRKVRLGEHSAVSFVSLYLLVDYWRDGIRLRMLASRDRMGGLAQPITAVSVIRIEQAPQVRQQEHQDPSCGPKPKGQFK